MLFSSDAPNAIKDRIASGINKEMVNPSLTLDYMPMEDYRPIQGLGDAFMQNLQIDSVSPVGIARASFSEPVKFNLELPIVRTRQSYIMISQLIYFAPLNFNVKSDVAFNGREFAGDESTAEHLNQKHQLIKLLKKFICSEFKAGESIFRINSLCKIIPGEDQADLLIHTTPKLTWFGLKSSFRLADFIAIIDVI